MKSMLALLVLVSSWSIQAQSGPDALSISFIRWISPTECSKLKDQAVDLVLSKKPSILDWRYSPTAPMRKTAIRMSVEMLCASSNQFFPPNLLGGGELGRFMKKKQHRGILSVGSGQLSCQEGRVTGYTKGRIYDHPGFTPISLRNPLAGDTTAFFEKAEKGKMTDHVQKLDGCVQRTIVARSRIRNLPGGIASRATLLNFPPWISRGVRYKICCDGTRKVEFFGSHFPSHQSYLNGTHVKSSLQKGFKEFLSKQGGTDARKVEFE